MKYLLDTHILLWAAAGQLPPPAIEYFSDDNELCFSPASIWEIVIKRSRNKDDFRIDPAEFHANLLEAGYKELPITAKHTLMVESLPDIHRDPFDRILLAQSLTEGIPLVTADEVVAKYPCRVIVIRH